MTESKRKPYNGDAGYVASRKCEDGGHVVVYDRQNGGDWIDGETRWIVAKYDAERMNQGLLDFPTKADAIGFMKDTAAGIATDWYEDAPK
jgi:hypothetical protein